MQEFFGRMKAVGKVLDVGAQYCRYYPLFEDKCESCSGSTVRVALADPFRLSCAAPMVRGKPEPMRYVQNDSSRFGELPWSPTSRGMTTI
jgi:hypothetical protein